MRLVVFCDEDLGISGGGSRQVLEFVCALGRRGHEICVIAPKPSHRLADGEESQRVQFRWVWAPRLPGLRPFAYLIASALVLGWVMLWWRPNVLLWFDSPGQVSPLLWAGLSGCPYVLYVNGLPDEELQGIWRWAPLLWLVRSGLKVSVRHAGVVVSVCQEILTEIQQRWDISPERCHIIRNGVDPDRFSPGDASVARRRLGLDLSARYVGFVGGFFPWHGVEILIDAVPIVSRAVPQAKFLLVGDGHERARLEVRARQLKLDDAVRFVGRVDLQEVPSWIAACELCVVLHKPTRSYPGDSMKLWEYLACARPVVATAGPGYGDFVDAIGCGVAVIANDREDLAKQIIRLLLDQDLRTTMGKRGRDAVMKEHTWEKRAEQLESLVRQLSSPTRHSIATPLSAGRGEI